MSSRGWRWRIFPSVKSTFHKVCEGRQRRLCPQPPCVSMLVGQRGGNHLLAEEPVDDSQLPLGESYKRWSACRQSALSSHPFPTLGWRLLFIWRHLFGIKDDIIQRLNKFVIVASPLSPMCCSTTGLRSYGPAAFNGWKEAIAAFTLQTWKYCSVSSDRSKFMNLSTSSISCSSSWKGRCTGKCSLRRMSSDKMTRWRRCPPAKADWLLLFCCQLFAPGCLPPWPIPPWSGICNRSYSFAYTSGRNNFSRLAEVCQPSSCFSCAPWGASAPFSLRTVLVSTSGCPLGVCEHSWVLLYQAVDTMYCISCRLQSQGSLTLQRKRKQHPFPQWFSVSVSSLIYEWASPFLQNPPARKWGISGRRSSPLLAPSSSLGRDCWVLKG